MRSTVPVNLKLALDLAGSRTEVKVEASIQDLVETVPVGAHRYGCVVIFENAVVSRDPEWRT